MNILFLTMSRRLMDINTKGIYTDLMRKFRNEGHSVYIIYPRERQLHIPTNLTVENGVNVLGVRTPNVQMTNVIEKGLGQALMGSLFKRAIKNYFGNVKFDLILYSTPPITFVDTIKWVKRHNPGVKSYLMLKDIFPQNAVDMGMLTKSGLKGLLYQSFRRKEKQLYKVSDYIGCMSPANVKYVVEHNPEVPPEKVEVCPNSYAIESTIQEVKVYKELIRRKYGLPLDKRIFIYGGNMGKPQGISFLLECLKANKERTDCHFLIVGSGTEYPKIEIWIKSDNPSNVSLFQYLPKADYDMLTDACDVGLIFLDYRFTIPNYPSRLLPYMMKKKPIIACTDPNCDTGTIAEANGYGIWCPSNSVDAFTIAVEKMLASDIQEMGQNGYMYFLKNYTDQSSYDAIMAHFENNHKCTNNSSKD